MKCYILGIVFLVDILPGFSQIDCEIVWNKEKSLAWSDFIGYCPNEEDQCLYKALTSSIIEVKPIKSDDYPNYIIEAKFIKGKSWVKSDTSNRLLKHEQLHFDMTELYARKIRKSIDSLRVNEIGDKNIYISKIKYWIYNADKEGSRYDLETYHGAYDKSQKIWSHQIYNEMLKFEAFELH